MQSNFLRRTGFRRQLTFTVTAAILCLALVSSVVSSLEASRRLRAHLVEAGQLVSANLARQSTLALLFQAPDNARDAVATTLAYPDVLQVDIYNQASQVLVTQVKPGTEPYPPMASTELHALLREGLIDETRTAWVFEAPVFNSATEQSPFNVQEEKPRLLGHVRVVIAKTTLNRLVNYLLGANLAITFSIAAILLMLLNILTRRMTQPLNALSALMRRAESGESGMRALPAGPLDIIEMAQAFNQMMNVLEQREAELKRSRDEAVRSGLLKAQFAATVSHEVRTPLNGVVGMLDMLKEMPLASQQKECVQEAWKSACSLTELINDILDFSKMDAGKLELEEIDFDLRQQVEEVMVMLAPSARNKGLALGYVMDTDVPQRVKGDPLRLRQVLTNLAGNAVKFTEHGEVAIQVSTVPAAGGQLGLHVDVTDTGIGMDAQAMENVFESFSQADLSTTRKYGGTGLGLAICKQLVELMGGSIRVRSEPQRGSTFSFTVVYRPAENQADTYPSPMLAGERVLVADSSQVVRRFVEISIVSDGGRCTAVATGPQALSMLQQGLEEQDPYALVIMEAGACDEQGADLSGRIRSDPALGLVRLLILTRQMSTRLGLALGADAYLDKPLLVGRLLEAVRRHVTPYGPQKSFPQQEVAERAAVLPLRGAKTGFRILVAEDNRTNKAVASGMLRMLGCECALASNGREAVEALRDRRFDLVLMDCSMPEVDGYEATARIRGLEENSGRRIPIIAMTANTQRGDEEKCLAANMDDYLPKPITLSELRRKLARWLPTEIEHLPLVHQVPESDTDREASLDREVFDNLRDVLGTSLAQAINPFLEDIPAYLDRFAEAIDQADTATARAMAHSIKGSSANLGANALSHIAKQAQEMAEQGHLDAMRQLLPLLHAAFGEVAAMLDNEVSAEPGLPVQPREEAALVLVVDDDRSTRTALRYTLQRDGFRIAEAANGKEALALLEHLSPDVILMDAVMPVMDGFEACAQVKERTPGRAIPVLMITALEDNTSVERAFASGASDYIPKPIHFAVLSQRVRSIIDASRAERHIRKLAYNDSLTGLPNRVLFLDQLGWRIEQAQQKSQSIAVLFLDLDRFKYVNDTLGHDVGDRLLKAVAHRIRSVVRRADSVARLGGDEFTVALTSASEPAAAAAAENICRTLKSSFHIDGHDIFIAASVGIAMYPQDGTDVGTLLKHADMAMYRAKKDSTGFHFFESAMEHSMSGQLRLENELRRALERHELDVFYQPKALVDSCEIVGMEALVRWHHPTRGLIGPTEFIPLAEETGLVIPVGEWVLRTACAQLQGWIDKGLPGLKMAVNISGRQLLQKDFVNMVERVLRDTGLAPRLLELEITESTLMEFAEDTLELLRRLRALGVRLSIDDFGTGYSSLAYLKRFPVNVLKIDQAFVHDVPDDADDMAIVGVIISLAHSLRLEVIAEGVETEAQLHFLRQQGCDQMQGYMLSEPVPAAVFEQKFLKPVPRLVHSV
jgi:diguanylate cyclase (GGDEF)-like protein